MRCVRSAFSLAITFPQVHVVSLSTGHAVPVVACAAVVGFGGASSAGIAYTLVGCSDQRKPALKSLRVAGAQRFFESIIIAAAFLTRKCTLQVQSYLLHRSRRERADSEADAASGVS